MSNFPDFLKQPATRMILDQPFFAQIFYALENIEDNNIPTAGTDGHRRYYNREFFTKMDIKEQIFVVCHEVCHDAFEHKWRIGTRDKMIWNMACDYYINARLVENGLTPPKEVLLNKKYEDGKKWSEEMIFDDLIKNSVTINLGSIGMDIMEGGEEEQEQQDGKGNKEGNKGKGKGSSASEEARQKIRSAVQTALSITKQFGKISGEMERKLREMLYPKISWQEQLKKYFRTMSWKDYDWTKINHREMLKSGFISPKLYSEDLGKILVTVDCSGSIQNEQLGEFESCINDIIGECNPVEIEVVYFDTHVLRRETFDKGSYPIKLTPVGGGGTDFSWLEKEDKGPEVCVFLTDGYGTFPTAEPPFEVIWVINHNSPIEVPFGETIYMRD